MAKKKSAATPALEVLDERGISYELRRYEADAHSAAGFALDSAEHLHVAPDAVYKTLMVEIDSAGGDQEIVVAVVPATAMLSLKAIARAAGGKTAQMLDRAKAQTVTGYVPGGISPVGQKHPHRVFVDESAIIQDPVFVSAGRRGWSVALAPDDLIAATGGEYAAIADYRRHR
ncbi:YbaK/ebsC protein [Corynebacterium atypicum]|uniref:Cys-tRNA(Pro)/Cys-tRNA(Cys) deacylase n=1 Tax=Corynebacterium atypicum TaxID=191610 RepID=A0ABN4DBM9_9CORY|nr:Cys-tRNA(Pro) deacylase [Corynebacterium atypicum]AIG63572.1 YbaK/ebsC protein [Corynebacterium atypicum]